jgi:hypothetical protein
MDQPASPDVEFTLIMSLILSQTTCTLVSHVVKPDGDEPMDSMDWPDPRELRHSEGNPKLVSETDLTDFNRRQTNFDRFHPSGHMMTQPAPDSLKDSTPSYVLPLAPISNGHAPVMSSF